MNQVETVRHVDRPGRIYGFEIDAGNNVFILYRASASSTLWQPAETLAQLNRQVEERINGRGGTQD